MALSKGFRKIIEQVNLATVMSGQSSVYLIWRD